MANRPRLPNVDPEDLAKLASQYPGSRASGATEGSSTSGTGSTGTGASGTPSSSRPLSSSLGRPGGPSVAGPGTPGPSASGSSASGGAAASGPSSSGAAPPPPAAGRNGGWATAFLTFIFAVIAVAGAIVSVGGPSYRAEIRALLTEYASDYLDESAINRITGYDTQSVELTYAALDQRVQQLTETLERIGSNEGVSGADVRELLFRDEVAAGLDSVTQRLEALSGQVASIASETTTQAEQITSLQNDVTTATERVSAELSAATKRVDSTLATTTERLNAEVTAAVQGLRGETAAGLEAMTAELETAVTGVQESISAIQAEVSATREEVVGLGERMGSAETTLEAQVAVDAMMTERLTSLDDRLARLISDFGDLLDLNDQVAQTVATFKTENMPILAVIQLRDAVNRSEPYGPELSFAKRVLNGAPGITAALEKLQRSSTDGIASIPELRRDLRLIANNLGTIINKAESWSDRMAGWFSMLVGATTVPEARRGGNFVAMVATTDDALDRGDLELAIREGAAIQAEWRSTALSDWLNAVIERMEVTDAIRKLEDVVYARATAPRTGQGAGKAQ